MKFVRIIVNVIVGFINLILGYFVVTGLYGYFIAYTSERKQEYLLATIVWIVVLVIVDSIYFLARVLFRKKSKYIEKRPVQDSFFFRREESPTQIVYRFKKSVFIYPILGIGFILYFLSINLQIFPRYILYWVYGVPTIIYFFMSFFSHLAPNKEIREATKRGFVKVSGSKFSVKNPLVVVIEKENE